MTKAKLPGLITPPRARLLLQVEAAGEGGLALRDPSPAVSAARNWLYRSGYLTGNLHCPTLAERTKQHTMPAIRAWAKEQQPAAVAHA